MTSKRLWDRVATVVLVLAIAATIGAAAFAANTERTRERFTEFYILDAAGATANYPRQLAIGETGAAILVIVNRERERLSYKVEVATGGETVQQIQGITLEDGERWEWRISFRFARPGPGQKAEFVLYRSPGLDPYRSVYLLVDILDRRPE